MMMTMSDAVVAAVVVYISVGCDHGGRDSSGFTVNVRH